MQTASIRLCRRQQPTMLAKRVARVNLQKMQKRRAISAQKVSTKMKRLHLTILAKGAEPASLCPIRDKMLAGRGNRASPGFPNRPEPPAQMLCVRGVLPARIKPKQSLRVQPSKHVTFVTRGLRHRTSSHPAQTVPRGSTKDKRPRA